MSGGRHPVPPAERAFYESEFAGATIVIGLTDLSADARVDLRLAATSLLRAGANPVVVIDGPEPDEGWTRFFEIVFGEEPVVLVDPAEPVDPDWLADLWIAIADRRTVVVDADGESIVAVAARLAAALGAHKLVLTDPGGGWGDPSRSFADVRHPEEGYRSALAERAGGHLVPAIEAALAGGVRSVNLCRPGDLDPELFTFDGTGTLFTDGGYLRVEALRVHDFPEVERLVARGTADGLLRPRSRSEIARLAITGLGARVLGGDHLAGIVSLETDPYRSERIGEVACLYAVSRFSGAGAGGLLVEALVDRAGRDGLRAVFAVTVSDAAADFFLRHGFAEVGHDRVPERKWEGYDEHRLAAARVFLRPTGPQVV